jgi:hypothetical protein
MRVQHTRFGQQWDVLPGCRTRFVTKWFLAISWEVKLLNRKQVIKTATISLLILSLVVPLFAIGSAQACWWRRPLRAKLDLNLDKIGQPSAQAPELPDGSIQTWTGYISGGINGYMRFYLLSMEPAGPNDELGNFVEIWQIFDKDPDVHPDAKLLMQGEDEGYTHQASGYYAMTGSVTYTSPEYAKWDGHVVLMYGRISPPPAEWGTIPVAEAPGYFWVF